MLIRDEGHREISAGQVSKMRAVEDKQHPLTSPVVLYAMSAYLAGFCMAITRACNPESAGES